QTCQQSKSHQHSVEFNSKELRASNQRSDTIDVLNYTINLTITDFTTNIITGNTEVKFTPKLNGVSVLNLDLLKLTVDSIKLNTSHLTYSYNDTLLSVNLPMAYNVTDTVSVSVYYHGTPQGDASGWGGFYFQSGYAYNLGVGFAANPHVYGRVWFPCFDNFVERSTYEFNITTNNGKVAYCNGYLANDTTDGSGNRTRKWILNEEIPTYLASVAVAGYTHVNRSYNGMNGTIPIMLTALPADTTNMKNSFTNLNSALSTFENRFGPYMWNRVGFCLVPFNSGAMEHATNIAYPRATANGSLQYQTLMAHELSHHWFGDLATCRTAEDMWLNEGWARYCEYIFTEGLSGYNAYLNAVRVTHEKNLQFNIVKEGNLSLANIPHQYTYGDHVYDKGADVAHTMRGYMGDSLFFYSVTNYLAQNNYTDVSSSDFMNSLTVSSGIDMSDFFNDWVFNPGWCHFSIDSFKVVQQTSTHEVTVYVKQKLTSAPNYYTNVPLNITFKAADLTEYKAGIVMSGQQASFVINVPFHPAFVAVNMDEKISHAVAPEIKIIKNSGANNFPNAKMNINVLAISDSAFVRVEHNYTAPDSIKTAYVPFRISPNHYWKVDGVLPTNFYAKATISYDGRTSAFSGNNWLDNLLNIVTEDSLILVYRQNTADDWREYPYYTKNTIGSVTDKRGSITIDSLKLGEYTFAIRDYALSITESIVTNKENGLVIYPNPANEEIKIDFKRRNVSLNDKLDYAVIDVNGKQVLSGKINAGSTVIALGVSELKNGLYLINVNKNGVLAANKKFVIAH
ncbi:MAG: T9SS type A sorting domain-containing protein, partial [Bacteroidia bacterium]|nr:T9SS type A sorting domain-containing protein [Bacteroidia bacterium]